MKVTYNQKGVIVTIILVIFICVITCFNFEIFKSTIPPVKESWKVEDHVGGLTQDNRVKQNFIPRYNYLKSMRILFGVPDSKQVKGNIKLEIFDNKEKLISEIIVPAIEFDDFKHYEFVIDKPVKAGKLYCYTITGIGTNVSTAPFVYMGVNDTTEQTILYIEKFKQEKSIVMNADYEIIHYKYLANVVFALMLLALLLCIHIDITNKMLKKVFEKMPLYFYLIILSNVSFWIVEFINGNDVITMQFSSYCLNVCIYYLLYGLFILISKNYKIACIIVNILIYILGVANYYVESFRGDPIMPWDIYAVKTAANVSSGYEYFVTKEIFIGAIAVLVLNIMIIKAHSTKFTMKRHIQHTIVNIFLGVVFFFAFYNTSMLDNLNITTNLWSQSNGYKTSGFFLSFMNNVQYMRISKPKGYSDEYVDAIIEENKNNKNSFSSKEEEPNIIVIMNEALADFSYIGEFETNEEYMPFLRNLKYNTVKGNLLVSTFGGGTANTEFEFLTSCATAFLPTGSIAYQQYIHEPIDSLCSTLEAQGYRSIAMHPYYNSGWNRKEVYPFIGFDTFLDIEDFKNPEYVHGYISDRTTYNKIIQLYQEKKEDEKLFVFDVTMQNHGGYMSSTYMKYDINIEGGGEYPRAEQYLSSIRESDEAIKELIEFFEGQEDPTVILMFGDHFPSVEPEFFAQLYGYDSLDELTLEEKQKMYTTPFWIWANYDIEEEYIDKISANYLAPLLLKTVGVEGSFYQKYLYELYQKIPAITILGYQNPEYDFYGFEDEVDVALDKDMEKYKVLQYNNLFGNNRRNEFFVP
jgi:phosphoglycerol transferase MdoB-like AlkP superfamily enzyme